uniref:hypothetical protein n=1 Tax=Methanolobus psychrotolerans TaxID=1874706 RepID=UPI001A9174D0
VGLRWMGEVLVENKDPRGYGLSVPEYARLDDGKIILTIRFYEDVTSENALSVVTKYTNNYTTPSSYYTYIYDIIIDENNITNVISEDAVHSYGYRNEETVSDDSFEDSEDIENNNVSSLIEDEDNTEIDSNNVNKSPGFSALISISVFGLVFCLCRKG